MFAPIHTTQSFDLYQTPCSIVSMAPRSKLAIARLEIGDLTQRIAKLTKLRDAWETIIAAEEEMSPTEKPIPPADTDTSSRGEKTGEMRRFLVTQNGNGVSKGALVQKAKELGTAPNFPYKFIERMKEAEELTESEDRYFATDKMRSKVQQIAGGAASNTAAIPVMHREPE